jgi:exodeoxyribonuclease VIII
MNDIIPTPGVYQAIPMEVYQAWNAISAGRLSDVRRAPLVAFWKKDHPDPPTPAMKFGTAIHSAILEPDIFSDSYVRRPPGHGSSTAYKTAKAELEAAGKEILDDDDWNACIEIGKAARCHPILGPLLGLEGTNVELSVVWNAISKSGIPVACKCRPDFLDRQTKIIVDLKTTTDATKDAFARQVFDLGYHRTAAHYLDGCRAAGIDVDAYLFFAIEKKPPYLTCLYQIDGASIEVGRTEVEGLIDIWARCLLNGIFPGLSTGVVPVGLPGWAWNRIMEGTGL